jgi:hypothetical protein
MHRRSSSEWLLAERTYVVADAGIHPRVAMYEYAEQVTVDRPYRDCEEAR